MNGGVTANGAAAADGVTGTGPWQRWRLGWHALFYLLLAYGTADSLADGSESAGGIALRVVPAAALAGWYGIWAFGSARGGLEGRRALGYLAGAGAGWLFLVVVDPAFVVLGLAVLVPFCVHRMRWAAAGIAIAVTGWALHGIGQGGGITWPRITVACLSVPVSIVLSGYLSAVSRQSRRRQRLIGELQQTRAELAAAERQAGVLDERQRLARDIHDTLTQGFASIVMLLEAAGPALDGHPARDRVDAALWAARENLTESRRMVWAMRPAPLCRAGLPEALGALAGRLAEETGIKAETVVTGEARPLPGEAETVLLRAAQEALANIRKHAHASNVTVTLSYFDDLTVLDVADDGTGFRCGETLGHGVGLLAMRERVTALGGAVEVESEPGQGTTVVVQVPAVPAAESGAA